MIKATGNERCSTCWCEPMRGTDMFEGDGGSLYCTGGDCFHTCADCDGRVTPKDVRRKDVADVDFVLCQTCYENTTAGKDERELQDWKDGQR